LVLKKKRHVVGGRRLVIVVGKAVSKKSVDRNLLKRRIRVVMRSFVGEAENDFTVIVRPEANKLSFKGLKSELENLLN
jgi:ribonuclease P protein component